MTLSRLHLLSHLLFALLVPVWWSMARGELPSPGLLALCAWLGLLPDIDSQASAIGRLLPEVSRQIERRVGHRTLTHSLLAVSVLTCGFALATADWPILTLSYGSHILLDMLVGGNTGVTLLWPLPARFKLGHINSASRGELMLTSFFGLLLMLPFVVPTTAAQVQALVTLPHQPTPTATATPRPPIPTLVSMRIDHVFDVDTEIRVRVGQPLQKGQLIADLVHWRATVIAAAPPTPSPTRLLQPTATHVTPTPYIAPTLDPLIAAAAWNDLQLERARATLTAAPPGEDEIQHCQSTLEAMRNALWADQLARDATKIRANEPGANIPWETIGAMEAKLFDQEREIAEQETRCTTLQQQEHAASPEQLELAAAQLAKAEIRYAQIVATSPPPATPTPTHTPTPSKTPTTVPTPDTSASYASSVTAGTVHGIKVVANDGRESTVQIDVVIGYGVNSGQLAVNPAPDSTAQVPRLAGRGELAVVTHVRDGDTVEVRFSDGSEEAIRLLDVDTPETKHPTKGVQCYGPEASHHTAERLCGDPSGDSCLGIEVQIEATGTDRYGRTLGYVWINGELFNEELTWLGLARYNDYGTKHQHSDRVAQAAAAAKAAGLGLWGACTDSDGT